MVIQKYFGSLSYFYCFSADAETEAADVITLDVDVTRKAYLLERGECYARK